MKKVVLLCTLTLALMGSGVIQGMESEYGHFTGFGGLSPEMQVMIIHALNTNDNLDDVIKAIKATSLVNKELHAIVDDMYGNLKGFTTLVHILAKKFNERPFDIAPLFRTPMAQKYASLTGALDNSVMTSEPNSLYIERFERSIKEGADINGQPLLVRVIAFSHLKTGNQPLTPIIKLLLDHGANPFLKSRDGRTALELLNSDYTFLPEYEQIKSLLENAMQKQQK